MKIYTRSGDAGETSLYGGVRVGKHHARVEAYGTLDECNSALGLARSQCEDALLDRYLAHMQNTLFDVGADLATPLDSHVRNTLVPIDNEDITALETLIDALDEELPPLKQFLHPGGHPAAAALHLARTIARRAERRTVELGEFESINPLTITYLNRLSDALFTLARVVNERAGIDEVKWQVKGRKTSPTSQEAV